MLGTRDRARPWGSRSGQSSKGPEERSEGLSKEAAVGPKGKRRMRVKKGRAKASVAGGSLATRRQDRDLSTDGTRKERNEWRKEADQTREMGK